jgi:hypothetical protein
MQGLLVSSRYKAIRQLGDKAKGYISGVRINYVCDQLIADRPTLEVCKVTDSLYEQDEKLLTTIVSERSINLTTGTITPALS